ncbi:hypothetical protein ACMDB5_10335 [Flavobacterium sp. W1B]|uniref:hypothetical protein n=1 Tax=Flavobacterium sp. W1B TaxID=3394146 RepID=UPI0039BC7AE7
MRPFNKNELKIIENLSKLDPKKMQTCTRFLQDTFFTSKSKLALIVKHDSKDLLFYIDSELFDNKEEINKKNHDLFELINLLDYLKSIRYLTIVSPSEKLNIFEALHSDFNNLRIENENKLILNENGYYLYTNSPDIIYDSENNEKLKSGKLNEYYEYIYSNMFGLIFPSEELIDFVKHDFKTKDDRKHKQNLFVGWVGIGLALILGILGIWNPFLTKDNSTQVLNKLKSINNNTSKISSDIKETNIELKKTYILKKDDISKEHK